MAVLRMVALGSSFAAGPGIEPVVDRAAGRSGRNYAHLVATRLGASLVDATVSGATTETVLRARQRVGLRTFPPQIELVTADADLVTVTAGGNDLGYLGGVLMTALLGQLGRCRLTSPVSSFARGRRVLRPVTPQQKESADEGLVSIVTGIRERAPRARVVLVDYLPVFSDSSTPGPSMPLTTNEIAHFREVASDLSAILAEASSRTGCDLVPASSLQPDHGAGSAAPWVNGLSLRRLASFFHPNVAGMQAVADRVVTLLAAGGSP